MSRDGKGKGTATERRQRIEQHLGRLGLKGLDIEAHLAWANDTKPAELEAAVSWISLWPPPKVPDFARGQVRDLRVRWALEEAGLSYETRLLGFGDQDKPEYRALQPFGQVPIYQEDGLTLFESGAIVLHIGEHCETLLPADAGARARAIQ